MYITPNEIVTYLPREIRETESKPELISHIIRGYRGLKIPQDKELVEFIIQISNSNYAIPDNIKNIQSVEYVHKTEDCDDCYQTTPVYPSTITNDLCADKRRCHNCELQYSIIERTLRLPAPGTYRLIYQQLFSDECLIFNDETLIDYLVAYTNYQITYNLSRRGDVQQYLLNYDDQKMNALYTKARGAVIMKAIKLKNYTLNTHLINLHYDEFNNRYYSNTATS